VSRRFGRNQKRALLALLAQSKTETQECKRLIRLADDALSLVESHNRRLRMAVERVSEVLGRHFYALDPVVVEVGYGPKEYRMPMIDRVPVTLRPNDEVINSVMSDIHTLDIYSAELKTDHLRLQTHVYLKTPKGELAYAMTREAFDSVPTSEMAARLAEVLARELMQYRDGKKPKPFRGGGQ
jgi:hypothetical protein